MVLRADELSAVLELEQSVGLGADAHRKDRNRALSEEIIGHRTHTAASVIAILPKPYVDPETGDILYRHES